MFGGAGWFRYDATNNKTPVAFSTNSMQKVAIVDIDDTRALLVYSLGINFTTYCYARVISVAENGVVTFGEQVEILSSDITFVEAKLINETQVLVACGTTQIYTFIITISGLEFADVGVTTTFANGVTLGKVKLAVISTTQFLLAYEDAANTDTKVAYGGISSTVITEGNTITLIDSDTDALIMETVSSGQALVFYNNKVQTRVDCSLVSVSGTTPVVDDTSVDIVRVGNHDTRVQAAVKIVDGKMLYAYRVDDEEDVVESFVLTVVDDEIFLSSTSIVNTGGDPEYLSITMVNDDQALVVLGLGTTGGISSKVLTISGTLVSSANSYSIVSGDKEEVVSATVGNSVVVAYSDDDDSSLGKLLVVLP